MWLNPTVATQFTTAFFGWATDSSWISLVPRGPGGLQHTMLWSGTQWFDGTFNAQVPVGAGRTWSWSVNNGTLNLYLNGQLANTMPDFPDVFTPAPPTQFALGVNFWDMPYNGLVDELKLYDEAIAWRTCASCTRSDPSALAGLSELRGPISSTSRAVSRRGSHRSPCINILCRAITWPSCTPSARDARNSRDSAESTEAVVTITQVSSVLHRFLRQYGNYARATLTSK